MRTTSEATNEGNDVAPQTATNYLTMHLD